ncbi:hypothetical protein [Maribacter sp. 2210JD10-5]|uniref:hypothetical protein n=1 Tax=Maribacter sp. 2210JD10-5 TaxID=3386272 RepID=UPI0039BC3381
MKNNTLSLLIGLICLFGNAQRVIEKNIDYDGQHIEMDVKFANEIDVKTWGKSTVYFKASISAKEEKYLNLYSVETNDTNNNITIASNAKPLYKAQREDCLQINNGDKRKCYNNGDLFEFNYTLYVPKNAKFKISSINGDLKSEVIEGTFTADLINGDIDIKEYAGILDLNTINGEIDLKMVNANLVAETIHGDIYADEKLKFDSTDRHVGQKIMGTVAEGKHTLRLNTINGNMYLRR